MGITHRTFLEDAGSSIHETLRFLPAGAEELPDQAFWTPAGLELRRQEPTAFRGDALRAQLSSYGDRLAGFLNLGRRLSVIEVILALVAVIATFAATVLSGPSWIALVAFAAWFTWSIAQGALAYARVRRIWKRWGRPASGRRRPPGSTNSRYLF